MLGPLNSMIKSRSDASHGVLKCIACHESDVHALVNVTLAVSQIGETVLGGTRAKPCKK